MPSLAYDKILHNNAAEAADILLSGESVGNFSNFNLVFGTVAPKETKDISSQLGKRVEVWKADSNWEASFVLQDWDFDKLDRFGLLNIVTAATKVRDELVSRAPSFPFVFKLGKFIDAVSNAITGETFTQAGSGASRTFTTAHGRIVPDSVSFGDGVETWTDDAFGVLTGSAGGTGKINYETGYAQVTWNSSSPGAVTNGAYSYYSDYQLNVKFYKGKIIPDGNVTYNPNGDGSISIPVRVLACVTSTGYGVEIEKVAST